MYFIFFWIINIYNFFFLHHLMFYCKKMLSFCKVSKDLEDQIYEWVILKLKFWGFMNEAMTYRHEIQWSVQHVTFNSWRSHVPHSFLWMCSNCWPTTPIFFSGWIDIKEKEEMIWRLVSKKNLAPFPRPYFHCYQRIFKVILLFHHGMPFIFPNLKLMSKFIKFLV